MLDTTLIISKYIAGFYVLLAMFWISLFALMGILPMSVNTETGSPAFVVFFTSIMAVYMLNFIVPGLITANLAAAAYDNFHKPN